MQDALDRLREWGTDKENSPAWITSSGVDPADERDDFPPRSVPVSQEERDDAVATSIFAAWGSRLAQAVFSDDFAGTGIGSPGDDSATKGLLHILEDIDSTDPGFVVHTKGANGESTLWDDKTTPAIETRDEVILRALADGLTFLGELFRSGQPQDWLWGGIHRVTFQHFFGQAGIQNFNIGNIPAPGSRFTVNPAHFSFNANTAGGFIFSDGPSQRFVTVLDPAGIRSVNIVPGGNNGNPCSPPAPPPNCGFDTASYNHINPANHYGDHIPGWINGEVFEYRVSREAVAADTQELISYQP
jgi:penicillin amidase